MHPRPNPRWRRRTASRGGWRRHREFHRAPDRAPTLTNCFAWRTKSTRGFDRRSKTPASSARSAWRQLLPDPAKGQARIDATGAAVADRVVADFDAAVSQTMFDRAAFEPYAQFLGTPLTEHASAGVADLVAILRSRTTSCRGGVRAGARAATRRSHWCCCAKEMSAANRATPPSTRSAPALSDCPA
jgi:hypothetical protein